MPQKVNHPLDARRHSSVAYARTPPEIAASNNLYNNIFMAISSG
ncbi:MAG: hypothetical protein ACI9HK_004389 [Pirellulaceae bacterium]|jgi:hypothetical protein